MSAIRRLSLLAAGALCATSAQAALLLSTSFSNNFPLGPFRPNEDIEIVVSLTNTSVTQTVTICEGPCIGDEFTYSLGGLASIPNGYSFYFGDKVPENVFDGRIAGALLPGEEKEFVFGNYTPIGFAAEGFYSFLTQLQIFDATADRLMLASPTFSGQWEVECREFPGGGATGGCFPGVPEPTSLSLLGLALAGLTVIRRR